MADPLIVCENLVKIYSLSGVEVMALQGLDLTIQPGELLGIVGASGSGKSTLLNVLGGLDRPSAGRVLVDGRDLLKISDAELDVYRRTQVGFVWQQTTRNLIPYLTALENVELPLRLTNKSRQERKARAEELLEAVGLGQRLHHLPAHLSGGEQQRTAIAVALANRPLILLADEPTGEVDTATALEIYAVLRSLNQAYGMTTIIVSHDQHLSQHTDRVVAIRDGKTSTETVRYVRRAAIHEEENTAGEALIEGQGNMDSAGAGQPGEHSPAEFEELVVLDGAGRLQIPRDYLETLNIGDRVRLELKNGRIIIHPVAGRGRVQAVQEAMPDPVDLYVDQPDPDLQPEDGSAAARVRRLLGRVRLPRRLPGGRAGSSNHD